MREQLDTILQEAEVIVGSDDEALGLSSLQVISIVTALEEVFGFVVQSHEVCAENFKNRAALLAFVTAKKQETK
jgi:acyl carrier protein